MVLRYSGILVFQDTDVRDVTMSAVYGKLKISGYKITGLSWLLEN